MTLTQIKETCLYVADLERTREFYQDRLDLPLIAMVPGRHVFFRVGRSVLLCFDPATTRDSGSLPGHYGSGELHLAFEVEAGEYDNWKQKLAEREIAIEAEMTWTGGGRSFYFRDPDRHCLEIVEPGIWGD